MGSEIVDDIKKLTEDLRGLHAAGGGETYRNAADALESLSAENTDLHTKLAEVEQARDEALALLNEKDAALNAARACDNDFARSVERGKHIITDQCLGRVIKENQQLKATLGRITEERNRARLERDTLEQNRRHALDNVVRDFMPGPGSGCDSRGVEDSLVLGAPDRRERGTEGKETTPNG